MSSQTLEPPEHETQLRKSLGAQVAANVGAAANAISPAVDRRAQAAAPFGLDFTRANEVTPEVEKQIDDAFEYHPWDEEQQRNGAAVRKALAIATKTLVQCVPPCPDRTTAIRKLREARMDANSAITHRGRY